MNIIRWVDIKIDTGECVLQELLDAIHKFA